MRHAGHTLMETIFAMGLFVLLLYAIAGLLPSTTSAARRGERILAASHVAQQIMETVRGLPFLLSGAQVDARLAGSPQFPGYPAVRVDGVVYACSVQLAALAAHPDGTPRVKQIVVTVTPQSGRAVTPVTLTTAAYDVLTP